MPIHAARAALGCDRSGDDRKAAGNLSQGDDLLRQLIEAQDETGSAMTDRQLLTKSGRSSWPAMKRRRWRLLIH